jgi:hypothetical protein
MPGKLTTLLERDLSRITAGAQITVGVIDTSKPHEGPGKKRPTMGQIATWNHNGTSRIPARPFISGYFDSAEGQLDLDRLARWWAHAVLNGADPAMASDRVGLTLVGGVKLRMATSGAYAPLAESTIARKKSSMPLIDKGLLRASVAHRVDR